MASRLGDRGRPRPLEREVLSRYERDSRRPRIPVWPMHGQTRVDVRRVSAFRPSRVFHHEPGPLRFRRRSGLGARGSGLGARGSGLAHRSAPKAGLPRRYRFAAARVRNVPDSKLDTDFRADNNRAFA